MRLEGGRKMKTPGAIVMLALVGAAAGCASQSGAKKGAAEAPEAAAAPAGEAPPPATTNAPPATEAAPAATEAAPAEKPDDGGVKVDKKGRHIVDGRPLVLVGAGHA